MSAFRPGSKLTGNDLRVVGLLSPPGVPAFPSPLSQSQRRRLSAHCVPLDMGDTGDTLLAMKLRCSLVPPSELPTSTTPQRCSLLPPLALPIRKASRRRSLPPPAAQPASKTWLFRSLLPPLGQPTSETSLLRSHLLPSVLLTLPWPCVAPVGRVLRPSNQDSKRPGDRWLSMHCLAMAPSGLQQSRPSESQWCWE